MEKEAKTSSRPLKALLDVFLIKKLLFLHALTKKKMLFDYLWMWMAEKHDASMLKRNVV